MSNIGLDDAQTVQHIIETLKANAKKVCTLGYSTGKDSSVMLDLVFRAYLKDPDLPQLNILYANTGLEAPTMARYVRGQINRVKLFIEENNLPVTFHETFPLPERSMWGRIIGHGYMMPLAKVAHWCTESLKLTPMKRKMEVLSDRSNKEVLSLVGVREQESGARKVSINASLIDEENNLMASRQAKNETIYAPLRTWSDDRVWDYINSGLVYTDSEEIKAVYNVTDSHGSLRSGCVFCPVVRRDKNLEVEAAKDPGLRWLLKWRNYLANLADPKHKAKLRHFRRQRGDVAFYYKKATRKKDQDRWEFQRGYYPQRIREHFLKVVLHVQMMTQRRVPDFQWISQAELDEIRRIWIERHGEIEDSLPVIYHNIFGSFWEVDTEWEIRSGVHKYFSFNKKMMLPGSWKMMAESAPQIDAERLLRTAHALNDTLENIAFKQSKGAWCDDLIEHAKSLKAAITKTDWRSENSAKEELASIVAAGGDPSKAFSLMGLQAARDHLHNGGNAVRSQQDADWERLLNMYDKVPVEKRTVEMKALIAEGMMYGADPRRGQQLTLAIEIKNRGAITTTYKTRRRGRNHAWQQPGLLAA